MGTVLSLYRASVKEFVRDRAAMFWTLAFPVLFIILFGLIFSGSGSPSYTVGLVNEDGGQVGSALTQAFHSVKPFNIKAGTFDNELSNLKKGQLDLVIVIPAGLSDQVRGQQTAQVAMYYDPSTNTTNAQIEQNIVQQVLASFNARYTQVVPPLALNTHTITTHTLSTVDFLMPGILAMALMQLGLFGTASPLVSLRQEGVLRRLGATPLPRWTLLASQVLLRITIGFAQSVVIVGLSVYAFKVQIQGNMLALAGLILLGAISFVAIGYLIAAVSRSVETAGGISSAVNFPMMFLSGIFFPLALLPAFLTPIVRAMPLTYLADAFRQVTIGSVPEFPMLVDIGVLVAWAIVCALLSARLFKWE
ncbi:MAG TPA: ABC transporter permease [Ktedonobacterales bacterium]|nr:ABC transporter permease [Ktedonobacterales bacterium]